MGAHLAQRHDAVARLEHPRRRLGQQRRVEHEVLGADERRPGASDQAGEGGAGEAAADDEGAAARLLLEHGSDRRRSSRKARS